MLIVLFVLMHKIIKLPCEVIVWHVLRGKTVHSCPVILVLFLIPVRAVQSGCSLSIIPFRGANGDSFTFHLMTLMTFVGVFLTVFVPGTPCH